ncbi:unnamed protein product [Moneuplotes crassus]|uniref:NAD(P)H-hydrate epimerase n=1 Tax=Euplotes crassus TaxID=5936 RepID=A0AAD1XNM1_EUPCR|nr:unnamed protein product [Moneuplotes crassus]
MEANFKHVSFEEMSGIDEDYDKECKYQVSQLIELEGFSAAQALYYHNLETNPDVKEPKVLVIVGPGINGGDALVAARHLKFFGYDITIFYPKRPKKEMLENLTLQCENISIPFIESLPEEFGSDSYDFILDGIFGFTFKGEIRSPFKEIIDQIGASGIKIVSVDVPSSWQCDEGNVNSTYTPDILISLTAPKKCSEGFSGVHYIAGRFTPKFIVDKYGLSVPPYEGCNQFGKIN